MPPAWKGETVFIVGGGPSAVSQPLQRLEGRKTIAINRSHLVVPFAPVLFFGDLRFWREYGHEASAFAGMIVTCEDKPRLFDKDKTRNARVLRLKRGKPPGLAMEPDTVILRRTSFASAINLAVHFGAARLLLIGLDGRKAPDGRCHHHADYMWPLRPDAFDEQHKDLESLVEPLKALGIETVNASPGTAFADLWPVTDLATVLDDEDLRLDPGRARASA